MVSGNWTYCTQVLVASGRGAFTHMSKVRSLLYFWENCVRSVGPLVKDLFWCVVVVTVGYIVKYCGRMWWKIWGPDTNKGKTVVGLTSDCLWEVNAVCARRLVILLRPSHRTLLIRSCRPGNVDAILLLCFQTNVRNVKNWIVKWMTPCLMAVVEGWVFVVAVQCLQDADSGDGRKLKLSFVLVHCGCSSSHFKFRSTFLYFCEVCNWNIDNF